MKSRTEILVPIAAIQAVPIAVIAWYRLHRYAWYRYSAIVTSQPKAQVQPSKTAFQINIGDGVKKVWIPNSVKDVFTNEVQIPEDNDIATTENVAHVAMLLFAGYIDAATSMSESCGGGGSAPSSGWGKKDDEDDWKFAHRCAQMAHSMCKPKPRYRFRR